MIGDTRCRIQLLVHPFPHIVRNGGLVIEHTTEMGAETVQIAVNNSMDALGDSLTLN